MYREPMPEISQNGLKFAAIFFLCFFTVFSFDFGRKIDNYPLKKKNP